MTSRFPLSGNDTIDTLKRKYDSSDKQQILEAGFYGALLFGLMFMLYTGRDLRWDDRAFSLLIGIPVLVLLVLQLLFIVRPDIRELVDFGDSDTENFQEKFGASIEKSDETGRSTKERHKYEILLIIWTIAFPIAMYYFGMMLVVPVYVFAFIMYFHGDLISAIVTTVSFSLVTYFIFVWFLNLRPWPGVLFG